jgi:hypothetical protein
MSDQPQPEPRDPFTPIDEFIAAAVKLLRRLVAE